MGRTQGGGCKSIDSVGTTSYAVCWAVLYGVVGVVIIFCSLSRLSDSFTTSQSV